MIFLVFLVQPILQLPALASLQEVAEVGQMVDGPMLPILVLEEQGVAGMATEG